MELAKLQPPKHLAHFSIWRDKLAILERKTQSNYIKIKLIQRLLNPTNDLWKYLILYWLKLVLNFDQGRPF